MKTHSTQRLILSAASIILVIVFALSQRAFACSDDSVTLKAGTSDDDARDNGVATFNIPVNGTAHFYATFTVDNPDELGTKWQFDLDGDNAYDDASESKAYDDTNNTHLHAYASHSYSSTPKSYSAKAQACLDDGEDNWITSSTCTVNAVKIEIVSPVSASFPKYIGIDTGLTLISEITPSSATGGTFTWSKASGPGTATFSPSDDSTTLFSADTVGSYTAKVEYVMRGGTCSDTSGTIEVVNAKMIFKTGTPEVEASSLTRAESGTFEIVDDDGDPIPGATYANWAFDGDDDVDASEASHTDRTWSGTIVESGTASCDVTFGGNTPEVSKAITVNARSGWSLTPTCIEDATEGWVNPHHDNSGYPGFAAGMCMNECIEHPDNGFILEPYGYGVTWPFAYETAQISAGPNKGICYITSSELISRHRTLICKFFKPGATGYPDPPNVNWHEYNESQNKDADALLQGAKNHEAYGTGGNRKGHQAFLVDAEDDPGQDAQAEIEANVAANLTTLKNNTGAELDAIEDYIYEKHSADPTWGDNFLEPLHWYDFDESEWIEVTFGG